MVQQRLENETTDGAPKNPPSPKSRLAVLKRNKKPANANSDPFRFQGNGVSYKGKLIGEREVPSARGDDMCAEAMRAAKATVKAAGAHKPRIQLQINIDGIKILDEKSGMILHNFPVSRISFVARDSTDNRAFGLVFGDSTNNYRFYGIKTAQAADQAVLAIRDMFQVVFEMKKKHIEQVKQQQSTEDPSATTTEGKVAVADLLDLETELHNIEQGVQQLQQIPTTDAFGATPFLDPFADSFNSNVSSVNASMASSFNGSMATPNASAYRPAPQPPMSQPMFSAFPAVPPVPQQMPQQIPQNVWATPTFSTHPPITHPHSQPALPTFSETNPFAVSAFSSSQVPTTDPFGTPSFTGIRREVDWGTNENTAPHLNHANSFAAFDSQAKTDLKWEDSKRVTSLEEAFTKLVDMDALVGPSETKKNPFEHIINPPKASLNSLTPRPPPVVAASSDPFGDDFFR